MFVYFLNQRLLFTIQYVFSFILTWVTLCILSRPSPHISLFFGQLFFMKNVKGWSLTYSLNYKFYNPGVFNHAGNSLTTHKDHVWNNFNPQNMFMKLIHICLLPYLGSCLWRMLKNGPQQSHIVWVACVGQLIVYGMLQYCVQVVWVLIQQLSVIYNNNNKKWNCQLF